MSGINAPFESFTALNHPRRNKQTNKNGYSKYVVFITFFSAIEEGQPNDNHE